VSSLRIPSSRRRSGRLPSRQRGIALLVAILLVAFGTIIAAAIGYENAMTARRGAANLALDESLLIGQGAEALAAYGLREVQRADKSHTIYPGQGWDSPVGPVEVVPGVMLEASLEDLQGRFNLNLLVDASTGQPNPQAFAAFQQLLEMLNIEPKWAGLLVDWIDADQIVTNPDGAEDSVYMGQTPPYRTPSMYITSASELLALPGFGHDRYVKLAPYVVALPITANTINLCTASGYVLDAFLGVGKREFSRDPEGLAKNRASAGTCFPTLAEYQQSLDKSPGTGATMFAQNSSYFRLTSFVTIGSAEFNLYSLLFQDGTGNVRTVLRSYTPD
jgi:general secretion pathway protein K